MKRAVKSLVPPRWRALLRRQWSRLFYFGFSRYCPLCGSHLRRFRRVAWLKNALCPVCGSFERHRSIWLYLTRKTDLFDGVPKRFLHVAPEPELARRIRKARSLTYVSADLASAHAAIRMDLTRIPFADDRFDAIYCSHVLEHIPDDRKAMAELRRILRPTGWAILQVPIMGRTTREDPSITSPDERERAFGQHDHVRSYGADYRDRLENAGFAVKVDRIEETYRQEEIRRCHLIREEEGYLPDDVYFCRKRG
jgi:SAM-dependent methyltransferase